MVSAGMSCIKYLLYAFNLLFSVSGIILLTIGAIVKHAYSQYDDVVGNLIDVPAVILIVVGIIIFVVAFFGCCGVIKENHCMVITFAVLLLIIFILELAAGIAGYVWQSSIETQVTKWFNVTMQNYPYNKDAHTTWDVIQTDLKCCGTESSDDWLSVFPNHTLPISCCKEIVVGGSCLKENAFQDGCLNIMKEQVQHHTMIVAGFGIGIPCIQLIGIIFACFLARSIRKEYETV